MAGGFEWVEDMLRPLARCCAEEEEEAAAAAAAASEIASAALSWLRLDSESCALLA